MFKPNRCVLEVTYSCNLRCQSCIIWKSSYAASRLRKQRYLATFQLKKLQRGLARAGITRLTYLGGEPFLRKDLLSIASHAQDCGISPAVVTNGTLINDALIEKLTKKRIFDIIIFSLDGPAHIHDQIRRMPGAFQQATAAIRNIQLRKKSNKLKYPKIFIYVTVSSLNYAYLESMVRLAQQLDVHELRFLSITVVDDTIIKRTNAIFNSPVIKLHSYQVKKKLKITAQHLPWITKELIRLEKYARKIGMRLWVERYLKNDKGASFCEYLGKDFVIAANGDVCPCPMLPNYILGNATHTPINKLLTEKKTLRRVEKIYALCADKKLPVCRECCVEKLSTK
jgi:radical SAM protein with 4Fe4S-binding SPASM domain